MKQLDVSSDEVTTQLDVSSDEMLFLRKSFQPLLG